MRHFSVLGIPGYGTAEKLKFRLTLRVRRNLRFSPNPTRIPRAQRRWGRYTQINTVFFWFGANWYFGISLMREEKRAV